ncbi:MAG: hypothetical protein IJF90_11170 [Synergistaceae bacterium]|nr:hypothetical protein [Synergistaceae bacterium]
MPAKTFSICGQTVTVSETYDAYNTLRLQFVQEASSAAQVFGKRYDSYGNIDNVIEHGLEDGLGIIAGIIDRVVINGVLMKLKIYDIDDERFFREFYQDKYFLWGDAFDEVQDQYMAIRLEQKQLDEYRTMRRQNRSRWVGGGFGIGGALKGAAKAGAMNMASGALHGLFNAGAKAISMASESSQKSSLYKNSATKNTLIGGIWSSVYQIHFAVWEILERHNGRMNVLCLTSGAEKKAEATVNNFARMPKKDVLAVLPQTMLLNPYNEELYKSLFSIFGDSDGGLQKAARYFGVDTSFITEGKEALADKIFADIKHELGKSEQAALSAKAEYEIALEANGVGDTLSAQNNLKAIEATLRDYDVKARTFDGETFRSRAEADEARKSVEDFERSIKACEYEKSEENARKALEIIMAYDAKTPSAKKRAEAKREEIGKVLVDFDVEARTVTSRVKKTTFDTREEAVKAREEVLEINKLLYGLDYEHSEDDARKALERLEGYSPNFRRIFNDYLDKLKSLLSSFDNEASTVSFSGQTVVLDREEAEKVKAMPEFNELTVSWEEYKAERTDGALNHIAELLEKMPSKIRKSFWGLMSEFETEQKKMVSNVGSPLKWGLVFLGSYIFMGSLESLENDFVEYKGLLAFIGLIALVMMPTSIVKGIRAIIKRRKSKKPSAYLSDFEKLSSQSEEYRNFKMTNTK